MNSIPLNGESTRSAWMELGVAGECDAWHSDARIPETAAPNQAVLSEVVKFVVDANALQTLNQELERRRATAEMSLAEARALLSRREAALEEERWRAASLEQALVQARMELEVLLERRRLAPARTTASTPPSEAQGAEAAGRSHHESEASDWREATGCEGLLIQKAGEARPAPN